MSNKERPLSTSLTDVSALDAPSDGHASHKYAIYDNQTGDELQRISFQKGPIKEKGVNGVQNEDLLAVVIDRLIGFQTGKFACPENQAALELIVEARAKLNLRTAMRKARGVEGKNEK